MTEGDNGGDSSPDRSAFNFTLCKQMIDSTDPRPRTDWRIFWVFLLGNLVKGRWKCGT